MNFRWIHTSLAHERRLIEQPGCLQVENQVIVLGDPLEECVSSETSAISRLVSAILPRSRRLCPPLPGRP